MSGHMTGKKEVNYTSIQVISVCLPIAQIGDEKIQFALTTNWYWAQQEGINSQLM